jgi:hypothetical protein
MAEVTRRSFLVQASAAGAAAAGVAAVPILQGTGGLAGRGQRAGLSEEVVVLLRDAATAEVAVLAGTGELVVHDEELAGRIASLAARALGR